MLVREFEKRLKVLDSNVLRMIGGEINKKRNLEAIEKMRKDDKSFMDKILEEYKEQFALFPYEVDELLNISLKERKLLEEYSKVRVYKTLNRYNKEMSLYDYRDVLKLKKSKNFKKEIDVLKYKFKNDHNKEIEEKKELAKINREKNKMLNEKRKDIIKYIECLYNEFGNNAKFIEAAYWCKYISKLARVEMINGKNNFDSYSLKNILLEFILKSKDVAIKLFDPEKAKTILCDYHYNLFKNCYNSSLEFLDINDFVANNKEEISNCCKCTKDFDCYKLIFIEFKLEGLKEKFYFYTKYQTAVYSFKININQAEKVNKEELKENEFRAFLGGDFDDDEMKIYSKRFLSSKINEFIDKNIII